MNTEHKAANPPQPAATISRKQTAPPAIAPEAVTPRKSLAAVEKPSVVSPKHTISALGASRRLSNNPCRLFIQKVRSHKARFELTSETPNQCSQHHIWAP